MDLVQEFTLAAYELNKIYEKINTAEDPELDALFDKIYAIYYLSIDGRE